MFDRLKPLAFPFLAISLAALAIIACAIAFTLYASQISGSATSSQGSAEYRNEQFRFSLLYPSDMAVTENNEAGGAQSLTFASASTAKQFVILAIPYLQVDIAAGEYAPHDAYGRPRPATARRERGRRRHRAILVCARRRHVRNHHLQGRRRLTRGHPQDLAVRLAASPTQAHVPARLVLYKT